LIRQRDSRSIGRMETVARTLFVDDKLVVLWLTSALDIPAAEFDECAAMTRKALRDHAVRPADMRSLVITDGGAPNAKQRKALAALANDEPTKSSVITTVLSNPIKRGIATALSWTNPTMKFFRPEEMNEALRHIDLREARTTIWSEYAQLQKDAPRNATLGLIAEATGLPAIR
jgi:hypothetical protein